MIHGKYKCDRCNKEFISKSSDEEKLLEYKMNFPECDMNAISIICDKCYKKFMKWFKTLTEKEKAIMRNDL